MSKRGISAVVATVLIVLTAVGGVAIVWVSTAPLIEDNLVNVNDNVHLKIISIGGYTVWDEDNELVSVRVERRGDSEICGLDLIFTIDGNSVINRDTDVPDINSKKVYYVNLSDYPGKLSKIAVAPVFCDSDLGDITEELKDNDIPQGDLQELIDNNILDEDDFEEPNEGVIEECVSDCPLAEEIDCGIHYIELDQCDNACDVLGTNQTCWFSEYCANSVCVVNLAEMIDFEDGWEIFNPNINNISRTDSWVREIRAGMGVDGTSAAYHKIIYDRDPSPIPSGENDWAATYRSESQQYRYGPVQGVEWYGCDIFLPLSYDNDSLAESIMQFKAYPDFDDEGNRLESWGNPVLALFTQNGKYSIIARYDENKITPIGSPPQKISLNTDLGPYEKGVWVNWVFYVNWDYAGNGDLKIWKDGDLVVDESPIAIGWNNDVGIYTKIGVYKWDWMKGVGDVTMREIYHDNCWRAPYDMRSP